MKLAATITLGLALTFASTASAQTPVAQSTPGSQPMPVASAPVNQVYDARPVYRSHRTVRQSPSFFGQLMELERRKNAWLMRTFLGR